MRDMNSSWKWLFLDGARVCVLVSVHVHVCICPFPITKIYFAFILH